MDSDERLLSRFVEGEEEAFEALVVRYEAPLRKLAYGLVRDWGLAEDIAQDAFIRAYRKATTYRGGASVKAWLYRIAINRAYDELRSLRRKKEVPLEQAGLFEWAGRQASTEAMAEARELQEHMARALAGLRPDYRTPLMLREIEGMTYREIADFLGWPLGTVQIRIHRGRLELRSRLTALKGSWLEGE
ncbi:MAG: sigma-70 family RNA polymerase sigma factor [Vicinamibacteria bacterium]